MKTSGREGPNRPPQARGASGPAAHSRRSNPLLGVELGEDEQRYIEGGEKTRPRTALNQPAVERKYSVGQVLLLIVLGGLLLGTAALIALNLFFPDWPRRKPLPPPPQASVAPQAPPVALPVVAPPPAQQATSPIEATKLMLRASVKGDTRTVYAQWDIRPDEIVTIERGVQVTLAEQTEEAAAQGDKLNLAEYQYRLSQQSSTEARVSQYRGDVLTQIYSLRRVGPYWKLYNARAPDR